ncbi:ABC transporter ATP-binding protein [Harryflintia acetispora]|uniref:Iron complex transport system ATP-binding protein n=1 Tax=Harryflintia acetispora TaxID=1849041 RepID=A0A9X8UKV4_9FIRM|nr:ABC transporter ATP-binding protein [Harryflintia acetispora]TCL44469.1 iron complex transport system ATP-binding protein [Harryflintia acetispora]
MADYFFKTKGLTVGYGGVPLIRDIGIQLQKGQILTLIGPNGSGKSTVLKSIAKYLKTICGTVYIGEDTIDGMSSLALAKQVAVVLTERLKTELMTCGDVVATGRYPYTGMLGILSAQDREQVQGAMELVGIWELRERDFTEISDGQRQRVLLARAICQQPQIIVLDEPTSYLDVRYKLELLGILRLMSRERGITVIMSLHELDLAQRISDLVMCLRGEYVVQIGPPEEIFCRELICKLYDLSNGSYNPLFGSFEMERSPGEAAVFVIAGGGTGIPAYRALHKSGIPFATGILHENDVDYQLARDLANEVVYAPAFERIGKAAYARALQRMKACGTVLCCLKSYGEMNQKNRELFEEAGRLGLRIIESAQEL